MKTLQDIKTLCAERDLNIDCILNNVKNVKQHSWFANLSDQEKTDFIFEYIEQWSRRKEQISFLQEKYDIPNGWACRDSHSVGKQLASALSSKPLFK